MWQPLPVQAHKATERDKYLRFLSTPMHRVYHSTSKYIWGKSLKSPFGQKKNSVHQVLVKCILNKPGFKEAWFMALFNLFREKFHIVMFVQERLDK